MSCEEFTPGAKEILFFSKTEKSHIRIYQKGKADRQAYVLWRFSEMIY